MMHKVKDVVSKFFHPSFLFAANGDTTRPVSQNIFNFIIYL